MYRTIRKSTSQDEEMHKSPSAPNLLQNLDSLKSSVPNVSIVGTRRSSCLPKIRNRVPPGLMRQALSIDCSAASPFLAGATTPTTCSTFSNSPLQAQPSIASTSSTTLGVSNPKYARKGMHRTVTNTSTVSEAYYSISVGESGESSISPSSQSHSFLTSTFSVDRASTSSGVTVKQSAAPNFTSGSGTVDLHLPNGMVTLNVVHATGALSGSATSLRTLSPFPSYQSEDNSSSFDLGSVKSDNVVIPKSPMLTKPPRFRTTDSLGRPALMRQSKVDHSEIFCIHDSDEDQKPIPEVEHESDTDAEL